MMKAIVLAAGKGTRLHPITDKYPKHLLHVGGKELLRRIIDDLYQSRHVDEIIIVTNYQRQLLEATVSSWYDDGITFVEQGQVLGTGDAVREALEQCNVSNEFIVVNGDVVFGSSLSTFIDNFSRTDTDGLIIGAEVDNPSHFGVLAQEGDFLVDLKEKPDAANPDDLVNAGFYIFPKDAIPLFNTLELSKRGERELTDVLHALISRDKNIHVIRTEGWFDIGHPWQLLDANEWLMDMEADDFEVLGTVEKGAVLHGNVHVAASARIRSGVYIEGPVYIDEGADIGPNCYIRGRSYLGKNVRVGNACEIKNSLIYEDSHAAHLSYIGDSIIGRHSNLGAGTITANLRHDGDDVKVTIKDTRKISGRRKLGVIMGDHVKTGIGVSILPGVKISSDTWVNADDTVIRDR